MNEKGGSCFPSVPTLARETGFAESTVRDSLKELAERGWLERDIRGGRESNRYRAMVPTPPGDGGVSNGSPHRESVVTPPLVGAEDVIEDGEGSKEPSLARGNGKPRERDVLWDALVAEFGEPLTAGERKRLNGVCKELRGANALPEQIPQAARAWASEFPDATLTDTALAKHWTRLVRRVTSSEPGARLLAAARARGHT